MRTLKLTERELRMLRLAVAYMLELSPDGDGQEDGPDRRALESALKKIDRT